MEVIGINGLMVGAILLAGVVLGFLLGRRTSAARARVRQLEGEVEELWKEHERAQAEIRAGRDKLERPRRISGRERTSSSAPRPRSGRAGTSSSAPGKVSSATAGRWRIISPAPRNDFAISRSSIGRSTATWPRALGSSVPRDSRSSRVVLASTRFQRSRRHPSPIRVETPGIDRQRGRDSGRSRVWIPLDWIGGPEVTVSTAARTGSRPGVSDPFPLRSPEDGRS